MSATGVSPRPSALTAIARGVAGRCPHCGAGRIMQTWFAIRPRCPVCDLRFERGQDDEHDHWLGAYTLNFIVTEVVFGIALLIVLVVTWPEPPWRLIIYGGAALMIVTPIVFYPFSKTIWLAIDLVFRPPEPDDFAATEDA